MRILAKADASCVLSGHRRPPFTTFIDSYDPVGNRTKRVQNGVPITWTYDPDYRLLGQQTAGGFATFAYDSAFNTLVKWHQGQNPQTMTYDPASRLKTSTLGAAITTFTFDNAGNTWLENTTGQVVTNSYDGENRLIRVVNANGIISTYTYAGTGLRRTNQEPGQPVYTTAWDGSDYLGEVQ